MNYDLIVFSKYNMVQAGADAAKSKADWLLFVQEGCALAEDALNQLEKYITVADENTAAFELRTAPVDTPRHTDPVTLEITHIDSSAVMIKRSAFEAVAGFDGNFNLLSFVDLSWRLRAAGHTLQACPMAVVKNETVADERYLYIYGQYERLLLGYKWGNDTQAKAEFEQTLKTPRHFEGVRKELAKLYALHFTKLPSLKKFRKTKLYNPLVCDFSDGFAPSRGVCALAETDYQPLVSVVVRTHKRKEVLRRTLMCLRNQIYKNFEIVIVEDGENTAEEMISSDFSDMNINYYSTGVNVGRGRAGNIGIERAKGELVAFLDDDDYYYPDYICAFVCKFAENPSADLLICGSMVYTSYIRSTDPYVYEVDQMYPIIYDHITLMDMCSQNRVPMPCAMFRREMYLKFGGLHETFIADEDWHMWLKFLAGGVRVNKYADDIHRALCLYGHPADREEAKKREEIYKPFEKAMLYDENLIFHIHGSEVQKWEEYVAADIGHLRNIGVLPQFMADLKPLGTEKLTYDPDGVNKLSARQINNYYYWLVQEYAK